MQFDYVQLWKSVEIHEIALALQSFLLMKTKYKIWHLAFYI